MSLTVASSLQASYPSGQVALAAPPASLASSMQQTLMEDYAQARQHYKHAHAQYSARVKASGPSRFEQYCDNAPQDTHFYTSAIDPGTCCPASRCSHDPASAGLHELNYQIRLRARERVRAAAAAKPTKRHFAGEDVFALLVRQEAAELADILELEATAFRQLAHEYYNYTFGPSNRLVAAEAQARRTLEDDCHAATAALLVKLRDATWQAEQRLMLRVYGMCPELLPHQSQLRAAAEAAASEQRRQIDAMGLAANDAVPLWHRACVICAETASEEDISFRRLLFACLVQAHTIEGGYLAHDAATGCLRLTGKAVPSYLRDAVEYGLQFEQFALVLREETERMAVMDAAEVAWTALFLPPEQATEPASLSL